MEQIKQNEHIEHALWVISVLKANYDTLTNESIFDWIIEINAELIRSCAGCNEALKIIGIVRRDFAELTSEHIFNQILKVEGLIKN